MPSAIERARGGPADDRLLAWALTAAVTLLAGFLRLWRLDHPAKFLFDETYYAKDGWSLVNHGHVLEYVDKANEKILAGQVEGLWEDGPSMVVHPEVGKWLIGAGEWAFGMEPYGWRFASAIVGALMVLVVIRLVRRLTHSTMLGLVAGVLMCFDGLHFVLSRLALLDIFQAFFVLCAVSAMVADRDWMRHRIADVAEAGALSGWGPRLLWRPWLLLAGLWWGLALGSKWGAVFPLAVFGLLLWAWSAGVRRMFGIRRAWLKSALLDAAPAVGYVVVLPVVIYVLTWTGWLLHAHEYEQVFSDTQYGPYWGTYLEQDARGFLPETWESLRSLWHYHHDVLAFHTKFLDDAKHVYQSNPWGWPLLNRPVGVDVELDIGPGEQGCDAAAGQTCLRQILLLGTPLLWWAGSVALLWGLVSQVWRRDWRYVLAVAGFAASWLPWLRYDDRPIFSYYAISMQPFLVIALTLMLGEILGRAPAGSRRRFWGATGAGAIVVGVVVNFAWFWPVYTDGLLTRDEWLLRIWFDRWI